MAHGGLMKSKVPPFSASTTPIIMDLAEEESPDLYILQPSSKPTSEDTHQWITKPKRPHNQTNNQHTPNPVAQLRPSRYLIFLGRYVWYNRITQHHQTLRTLHTTLYNTPTRQNQWNNYMGSTSHEEWNHSTSYSH